MTLSVDRRQLLKWSAALGLAGSFPLPAFATNKLELGSKQITAISDGNLSQPVKMLFPEIPKAEIEAILSANGFPLGALEPPCNVTLLRDADRLVLFDVGAGANFQPTAGKLLESLAAAGVEPGDVTDVVFTHAHPDHLWGLVDEFDEFVFANAQHHMGEVEWNYWRAGDTLDKMPEERKTFVVGAQARLALLEESIKLFKFGAEVLPGIEAVDTSGHTPGHTAFAIYDGSQSVMVLGDAITQSAVSFQKPDWHAGSDHDPVKGAQTRTALLDRLANEKTGFVGYHLTHPGIGRAERDGSSYRYVAG